MEPLRYFKAFLKLFHDDNMTYRDLCIMSDLKRWLQNNKITACDVLLFIASQKIKLYQGHGVALRRKDLQKNSLGSCYSKFEDSDRTEQTLAFKGAINAVGTK